jgi:hypothetical protein
MGLTRVRAEQISNIDYKQAVRVITLANITLVGGAPSQVDGVNLNANDRVLVAGQTTTSQNGLYDVQVLGSGADGTWVRTSDANATGEINAGMIVMVTEGTTYGDTSWKLITNDPIVIGTTGLVFAQNTGASFGVINANGTPVAANGVTSTAVFSSGNNLVLTGNATSDTITFAVSDTPVFGTVSATGNITGNYILGNGSQLTGLPATYANANVQSYLASNANVVIATTGNITTTSNISGAYILGNGSQLTGLPAGYANANAVAYGEAGWAGNIIPGANATYSLGSPTAQWASVYIGANTLYLGSTGLSANNSSNTLLVNGVAVATTTSPGNLNTAGNISATGNVIGSYILGNGSQLTSITGANVSGTVANATYAVNSGTSATVTTNAQPNITSVGALTSLTSTGLISTTGNVTGNYIIGNGSLLTNINASNITGAYSNTNVSSFLAAFGSNTISTTGTINSGNVTGSNILTAGAVSATGNVTGNYIFGNGSQLTSITGANVSGTVANATYAVAAGTAATVTTNAQPNITSVGTLTSLNTGAVSSSGNVTGANILTGGLISATGNVTGNYILGNGVSLTGVITSVANINNGTSNVTVTTSGGNITVGVGGTANVAVFASTGEYVTGVVSATGNVTGGNVTANGTIAVGGIKLSGNLIVGDGPTLTIDPNGSGGTDGNVVITGNLTVQGTTTTINSNTISTNDLTINMANNAANATAANNGGIEVGPVGSPYATLLYNTAANVWVSSLGISTVGNITANNLSANTVTGTLSTAAQTNITSVGTLTSLNSGTISSSGNVTGANILTGGLISATGNATVGNVSATNHTGTTVSVSGTVTAASVVGGVITGTSTSVTGTTTAASVVGGVITGTSTSVTGNVNGANIVSGALVQGVTLSASGNVISGNVTTVGLISATGAITGAALTGTSLTVATGNITAGNLILSGAIIDSAQLDIQTSAANANIVLTPNGSGNVNTPANVSVTGNVQSGNVRTVGLISATGNVTGNYFIGNGSALTGITVSGSLSWTTQANTAPTGVNPGSFWYDSFSGVKYQYTNDGTSNIWVDQSFPTSFTTLAVTGNATIGGNLGVTGTLTYGNISTAGFASVTGNVIGGNIQTGGNLVFTGTSNRITGDFSNATVASRVMFQSSTANGITRISAIPNGSGAGSIFTAYGATDPTNSGTFSIYQNASASALIAAITGTGTYTPITMATGGSERLRIDTSGTVSVVGNVQAGNITTVGLVSATGAITGGSATVGTGNVTAGNLLISGAIVDSAQLDIQTSAANANIVLTPNGSGNVNTGANVSITGNVQGGNIRTVGLISATGNIAGGNLSVANGTITVGNIVTLGNVAGNIGSSTNYFNTVFAKATSAQYADLAEMYCADEDYEPGTVVEFGGVEEVTVTTTSHSPAVAGIVSTNPSYLMNATLDCTNAVVVALVGRVPCKVVGKINKGDRLVASDIPGVAQALDMLKYQPSCIIGKALENYDSTESGVIEVAVGRT